MTEHLSTARPARGTRPANRRQLILDAATQLFYVHGYDNVGMSDIASAVGVGPSALYRHFGGKQAVLGAVVEQSVARMLAVMGEVFDDPSRDVATELARVLSTERAFGMLWRREVRHLDSDARADVLEKGRAAVGRLAATVRGRRPELGVREAQLVAWSAMGAGSSLSLHSLALPEPELIALLAEIIRACLEAPVPALPEASTVAPVTNDSRPPLSSSTRAGVLAAAAELFAVRGVSGVSMDDIGVRVGIAGPSVYNHFANKSEILAAVLFRGADWLRVDLDRILARTRDPHDAIEQMLESYCRFVFDYPYLTQLIVTELRQLPEADRLRALDVQNSYVSEWVRVVRTLHPVWDAVRARIRVHAVLAILNDLSLTRPENLSPQLDHALVVVCGEVLEISRTINGST